MAQPTGLGCAATRSLSLVARINEVTAVKVKLLARAAPTPELATQTLIQECALTLHVSSKAQRVELRDAANAVVWSAPVSTSKFGLGEEPGSFKTPRGRHRIAEKIGDGAPLGAIFESRVFAGKIWDRKPSEQDLITTRILWLAGDEECNQWTHNRYIYFHGTNHEDEIGTPASHGCIRMTNDDMKILFEKVPVNTPVYIE